MAFTRVEGKIGSMRKSRSWTVYPRKDATAEIIFQSEKEIGALDPVSGAARLATSGCYFVDLPRARPCVLPDAMRAALLAVPVVGLAPVRVL